MRSGIDCDIDAASTTQEDSYAGVTDRWSLHSRLSSYREGLEVVYVEGEPRYPLTEVLRVAADLEGLDKYSQGQFSLRHHLKVAFLRSDIASVTHEERGAKRALLDDTGADILAGLAVIYAQSVHGIKFSEVVETLLREVRPNRRLAEPLERFVK